MQKEWQALGFLDTPTSKIVLDRANIEAINFIICYRAGRLSKIDFELACYSK